jgi:hypothetical protein
VDEREKRIAENEALFRQVNERASELNEQWDEHGALGSQFSILCECADAGCVASISLKRGEYEALRAHGARFAVLSGHQLPDVERVVGTHEAFLVIEKVGSPKGFVATLDPRAS